MRKLRYIFVSLMLLMSFSTAWAGDSVRHEKVPFFKSIGNKMYKFVKAFNTIDTNYIEPQHYNFTVMLQNTNNFEVYQMGFSKGRSLKFVSDPQIKIGPYFGWRWIFLGYTLDLNKIDISDGRKEFDLSLYSSMIGVDLFYRKSGNNCKIERVKLGDGINTKSLEDIKFSGLDVSVKGLNLYYIFNHKKFSYPAAFSQSTCQKRSCGSAIAGFGYTKHSLNLDYKELVDVINSHLPNNNIVLDESFKFRRIKYTDISLSGGYAYNWVFAKNFLFCASLSAAVGYNKSTGKEIKTSESYRKFSLHNFNVDGIGRFGVVWNNTRWYCGASSIFHTYNYRRSHFSSRNTFGTINIYFGYNFDRR